MSSDLDYSVYFLEEKGTIVYTGITTNPERRAKEWKRKYPQLDFRIQISGLSEQDARGIEGGNIRALKLQEHGLNRNGSAPARMWRMKWSAKGRYVKDLPAKPKVKKTPERKPKPINPAQNTIDFGKKETSGMPKEEYPNPFASKNPQIPKLEAFLLDWLEGKDEPS